MSDLEDTLDDVKKKTLNKYKTKSFEPLSVSVDKNKIKVKNTDSEKEKEFEDVVTIIKEKFDRDFYVFTDNLDQIENVGCSYFLDTDYNMVSGAYESGVLEMSRGNFTETKNEKEFYEFFKRGNVVDLKIDCTNNTLVAEDLLVVESIPMLLNGGHFFYMALFLLMPFGMQIVRCWRDCMNRFCCMPEDRIGGKEF